MADAGQATATTGDHGQHHESSAMGYVIVYLVLLGLTVMLKPALLPLWRQTV